MKKKNSRSVTVTSILKKPKETSRSYAIVSGLNLPLLVIIGRVTRQWN